MGGGNSKEEKERKINMSQWISVGQANGADIVNSNMGNGMGEMRVIPLDPRHDLDKEMKIYSYRKNQPALVKCLGAESLKAKSQTMCGNEQTVKVITERIPKRWSELPQLTFPESLYALSESLKGYENLNEKAGVFDISPEMIGVNNNGEVKVWVNDNFADNHPAFEKPVLQSTVVDSDPYSSNVSDSQMVRNIVDVIEQKCENGRFPNDFRDRIHSHSRSFDEAINVTEAYIKEGNLFVPDCINLAEIQGQPVTYKSNAVETRQISTFQPQVQQFKKQSSSNAIGAVGTVPKYENQYSTTKYELASDNRNQVYSFSNKNTFDNPIANRTESYFVSPQPEINPIANRTQSYFVSSKPETYQASSFNNVYPSSNYGYNEGKKSGAGSSSYMFSYQSPASNLEYKPVESNQYAPVAATDYKPYQSPVYTPSYSYQTNEVVSREKIEISQVRKDY